MSRPLRSILDYDIWQRDASKQSALNKYNDGRRVKVYGNDNDLISLNSPDVKLLLIRDLSYDSM